MIGRSEDRELCIITDGTTFIWHCAFWFPAAECRERREVLWGAAQSRYRWALQRPECLRGELSRNLNGESLRWLFGTLQHKCLQACALSLSLSHCSAFSPFPVGQWILCFPERRWPNISTALQGRYTSQYYQRAAGKLLIKHPHCFPLQLISSVWSPQSIEFSLRQFCLPFLRLSCLLQHHLYGDNLTGCLVRLTITVKSYPASLSLQTERSIPLPYC